MTQGCIPVVVSGVALPFSDVLDWTLASIQCPSCELEQVVEKLRSIPEAMVAEWRSQVLYLYNRYFSSMAAIVLATLDIIDERVFPISARSYGVSHVHCSSIIDECSCFPVLCALYDTVLFCCHAVVE